MFKNHFSIIGIIIALLLVSVFTNAQNVSLQTYVVNPLGDSNLTVEIIQNQTELKSTSKDFRIKEFVLYVTNTHNQDLTMPNTMGKFRLPILSILKNIKKGEILIFDEIRAYDKDGNIVKLKTLVLQAS